MSGAPALLVEASPGERRIALAQDEALLGYSVERAGRGDGVGAIHLGRVLRAMPALAGAFVAIGGGAEGFLPFTEIGPGGKRAPAEGSAPRPAVGEGEILPVQIIRAPQAGKGPRLSGRLRLESRRWRLDPLGTAAPLLGEPAPPGSAAEDRTEQDWLATEAAALRETLAIARNAGKAPCLLRAAPEAALRWLRDAPAGIGAIRTNDAPLHGRMIAFARGAAPALAGLIAMHRGPAPLIDAALADAEAALAQPEVALPGGGSLRILPAPALTSIDIDTGGAAGTRQREPTAHASFNIAAAGTVAQHILLRNLSGLVLVDFVSLTRPEARAAVLTALRQGLTADPLGAEVLGWTRGGMVEVRRRRVHAPLHELLGGPWAVWQPSDETLALAALRQAWREAMAAPALSPRLRVAPAVAAAIGREALALADFATTTGRALEVVADPALAPGAVLVEQT
ncbi:MAG: ribonuclease E/G [Alphaproteobacteria bacterium]|nr:ribonuclease E/G [Alphaproteobacteria bacterium]